MSRFIEEASHSPRVALDPKFYTAYRVPYSARHRPVNREPTERRSETDPLHHTSEL
jgi:hypothetical protein